MPGQSPTPPRLICTFARRSGRITRAQRSALERHWRTYGVAGEALLDLEALFGRSAPVALEVGFGMGDALVAMASGDPQRDFLGIDVYEPGIGATLAALARTGLTNVRLMRGDARQLIAGSLPARSLRTVMIYFPDPWPKKRHHKRRLVQPQFAGLLVSRLEPGGTLQLATDWQDYAEHMLEVLDRTDGLVNLSGHGFSPRPANRPLTKFERRGERLGHQVWDLHFQRRDEP